MKKQHLLFPANASGRLVYFSWRYHVILDVIKQEKYCYHFTVVAY